VRTATVHPIARLPEEWQSSLGVRGERAFAAKQVFDWIHRRGVVDAAAMTNLAARLREALTEEGLSPGLLVPERVHRSADGTRQIAVRLRDGALIETVLLPAVSGRGSAAQIAAESADDEDEADEEGEAGEQAGSIRVTQCIST